MQKAFVLLFANFYCSTNAVASTATKQTKFGFGQKTLIFESEEKTNLIANYTEEKKHNLYMRTSDKRKLIQRRKVLKGETSDIY